MIYFIDINWIVSSRHIDPKTKAVLVEGLSKFEKFQNILEDKNESYYVQSQAAREFGIVADDKSISLLEQILETDNSK
jgi:hypothetical protein